MSDFLTLVFFALFAGSSATHSIDPKDYCTKQQFMVTQVGIEATIEGGNAVGGRHLIFSAQDYVNQRFYTNYSLTLVDTNDRVLTTVGYELIIDVRQNAQYEIRNGNCQKFPVPDAFSSHLTQCLSDKMSHQGSSFIGGFKSSDKALRFETFSMNLEMPDDGPDVDNDHDDDGGIQGLTGQVWVTYVENPDDPGNYLQVKEEMIGSVNVPSLSSNTISSMFSSNFVDYEDGVDEARFKVPESCPSEDSLAAGGDLNSRSRRALSAKHFRLARYAAVLFAYEL